MAGLIPQPFIDDLLNRVDIVDVVDKRVTLKKSGKNYSACCPFHNEKTPSFSVQPEKQFYYCFGCGAGGNAIGFVMNYDNVEFPQAVEMLAVDAGVEVPREESKADNKRQADNAKLYAVLEQANKFYQLQLRQHSKRSEAVDYLKARGLSGNIAKQFAIGFAPPGWDNLLLALHHNDDAQNRQTQTSLLRTGMIIEKDPEKSASAADGNSGTTKQRNYYDRFRHRIIFPIRDSRGRTVAFGGRVLGDDKPKYLNSPETDVFYKSAELYGLFENRKVSSKLSRFLIVEGYMDVIALAQSNINYAVATLGTATNAGHLQRLFRLVPEVVFCFDGDEAGRKAAWRALQATLPLMEDGRQVKFLFLPEGEDPDTLVRNIGQAQFEVMIGNATALETFFYDKLSQDLDPESIEGKARLSNLAKPLIKLLPPGIYAQLMLDKLAALLGVGTGSISALFSDEPNPAPAQTNYQTSAMPNYGNIPAHTQEDHGYSSEQSDFSGRPGGAYPNQANFGAARPTNPNSFRNTPKNKGLEGYRKPASLKAIQLLLQKPDVVQAINQDLTTLKSAEDGSRKLLLKLIEMLQQKPDTDTYTLMGYCYASEFGSQLTRLMKSESITPQDGVELEFLQIIDSILGDIQRTLNRLEIRNKVQNKAIELNQQN